ncbi:hypothetical protein [Saccharopolyspora taberi]|uniref:Uncharacterized protein n=1 Tax=Saccharopolyspora taberi TaxID=60895 RepID=A0ABN3VBW7_9PSEU
MELERLRLAFSEVLLHTLRILSFLSILGGVVSAVLVWSHGHPHEWWSLWTLTDLFVVILVLLGLRYVNRRVNGVSPATRLRPILAEPWKCARAHRR